MTLPSRLAHRAPRIPRTVPIFLGLGILVACSDGEGGDDGHDAGSVGSAATGGGWAAGGTTSSGGASSSGGATTGGSAAGGAGSGSEATGGAPSGGGPSTGGTSSGGGEATGGAAGSGGATGSGGTTGGSGTGGSPGSAGGVVGEPIGFATLNGGTTGGQAGETVTVESYAELKSYAEASQPYVILVQGRITNGSGGGQIRVKSNKSIVGIGKDAFLDGVGIDVSSQNNVILQNLRATLVGTTTPASVNGGDVISISGTSKNIWIDHCEVYSEDPSVQTDKDRYDGLIDIKGQTGFITISWTYLHDHHKGGLVGAADDDLHDDRKVTMHHNHYKNVLLRVPMYRGAVGHFFNNYIVGAKDATEIRANTCVRVERNYYEALHYSIYTPSDSPGKAERISNVEVSRTSRAYPANCTADIPYSYSAALTSDTNDVKTVVPASAGVGKL
jgi:pectate lyase